MPGHKMCLSAGLLILEVCWNSGLPRDPLRCGTQLCPRSDTPPAGVLFPRPHPTSFPTLLSGKVDHQPQCPRTLFRISRICGLIHTRSWRAPEGLLGPQAMSSPRLLPAQSPCLAPPVVAEPPRPLPVREIPLPLLHPPYTPPVISQTARLGS